MTRFTVNNQPVAYKMDPRTPLLWALRDASNLTGTKYGCGTGDCGACTVDVDGTARLACQETIGALEARSSAGTAIAAATTVATGTATAIAAASGPRNPNGNRDRNWNNDRRGNDWNRNNDRGWNDRNRWTTIPAAAGTVAAGTATIAAAGTMAGATTAATIGATIATATAASTPAALLCAVGLGYGYRRFTSATR
eukprot:tig00001467_g8774.t1